MKLLLSLARPVEEGLPPRVEGMLNGGVERCRIATEHAKTICRQEGPHISFLAEIYCCVQLQIRMQIDLNISSDFLVSQIGVT